MSDPPLHDLISLEIVVDPTYDQNCYVLRRRDSNGVLVVDPGLQHPTLLRHLEAEGLHCERIMLTHGHGDHVNGVPAVRAAHGCGAAIHPYDRDLLPHFRRLPGIPQDAPDVVCDADLVVGEPILWHGMRIDVLFTPGHTRGSVCFLLQPDADAPELIAGDTLFRRGVGRTDLPGGSWETLIESITTVLYPLRAGTVVHPGHGPSTTIGEEASGNPFVVHPRYR